MRIDPPPSLPCAIGPSPAASALPAPPLEPPAVRSRFHGLRAGGHSPPSVVGRPPNSGVVVLPSRIPPELRIWMTVLSSAGGLKFSKFFDPIEVVMSLVQLRSLIEY